MTHATAHIADYSDLMDAGYQIILSDYESVSYQLSELGNTEWEFAYVTESYAVHNQISTLMKNKRPVTLWILGNECIDMSFVQSELEAMMAMKDDIMFGSVEEIAANVRTFSNEKTAAANALEQFVETQENRLDELQKMITALYE